MTGIEELRKAVNVFNNTRESAIDSYTAEQLILIYRAYKRSEWDITPDAWTQEELAAALRGEGRGAESDDPDRGMRSYRIEVRGEWAGSVSSDWRPAISGTLNQTGESDEEASTCDTHDEAQATLENVCLVELPEGEDNRFNAPQFRIVES